MQNYCPSPHPYFANMLTSLCLLALAFVSPLMAAALAVVPGATWTDTSGNVIQAHGGGILKVCILIHEQTKAIIFQY